MTKPGPEAILRAWRAAEHESPAATGASPARGRALAATAVLGAVAAALLLQSPDSGRNLLRAGHTGGLMGDQRGSHMQSVTTIIGAATVAIPLALSANASAQQGAAVQWRVEDGGNGHWYQGLLLPPELPLGWAAVREVARTQGADLASLTTNAEANWLYDRVASNPSLWEGDFGPYVGLYQAAGSSEPSGGWTWLDGNPNTGSVPWYWNQPDNYAAACGGDQVASYWTGGPWFPAPRNFLGDIAASGFCCCDTGTFGDRIPSAILEWSADCNNDGIVDYGQILQEQLADANSNGIPDLCEVPTCADADLNPNGAVDGADLGALLAFWGPVSPAFPRADINGDGNVNGADLGILLSVWGPCGG